MREFIKVSRNTAPEVVAVALQAFPSYTGRKFTITTFPGPMDLTSGWDGGSRDEYRVVPIIKGMFEELAVPENGTFPTQNEGRKCILSDLPEGMALVKHSVCCGRDVGLVVYVNPSNFNANLVTEGRVA